VKAIELYDMVAEDPRLREVLGRFVVAENRRAGCRPDLSFASGWATIGGNWSKGAS
jgi:hypothetical protein